MTFLEAHVSAEETKVLACISSKKDHETDFESVCSTTKATGDSPFFRVTASDHKEPVVICHRRRPVPPEKALQWTEKLFQNLNPSQVVILTSSSACDYHTKDPENVPSDFVKVLKTDSWQKRFQEVERSFLETPSVIGGLATPVFLGVWAFLVADYIIKVNPTKDSNDLGNKVIDSMRPADQTIECSGAEASFHTAVYATKSVDTLVVVGMGKPIINFSIVDAFFREVDIRGIFRYVNCYPKALALVASGAVNVKPLVTHHFKLEESLAAFETSRTGAGGAIKVTIHCNKGSKI